MPSSVISSLWVSLSRFVRYSWFSLPRRNLCFFFALGGNIGRQQRTSVTDATGWGCLLSIAGPVPRPKWDTLYFCRKLKTTEISFLCCLRDIYSVLVIRGGWGIIYFAASINKLKGSLSRDFLSTTERSTMKYSIKFISSREKNWGCQIDTSFIQQIFLPIMVHSPHDILHINICYTNLLTEFSTVVVFLRSK